MRKITVVRKPEFAETCAASSDRNRTSCFVKQLPAGIMHDASNWRFARDDAQRRTANYPRKYTSAVSYMPAKWMRMRMTPPNQITATPAAFRSNP